MREDTLSVSRGPETVYQQSRLLLHHACGEAQNQLKVSTQQETKTVYQTESRMVEGGATPPHNPALRRQTDLCEFKSSLGYLVSSDQPELHSGRLCLKKYIFKIRREEQLRKTPGVDL